MEKAQYILIDPMYEQAHKTEHKSFRKLKAHIKYKAVKPNHFSPKTLLLHTTAPLAICPFLLTSRPKLRDGQNKKKR